MNPLLEKLHVYPFEKLANLKQGIVPPDGLSHISLSIGEPRHAPPQFVIDELVANLDGLAAYPMAKGSDALREAAAAWVNRRYQLDEFGIDPHTQLLPVTGTREGLFAFVQAVVNPAEHSIVMMPNPFYQIYEGAALLAGAEPHYLNTIPENGFLPDFDSVPKEILDKASILFLCTPGNPTGAVMDLEYLRKIIELADRHDFIVASDECYAEIYRDNANPPPGLLEACRVNGRNNYRRCIVFHSLSKRSNLPGLRSGFVAGDADIINRFLLYRTYHGCAMSLPVQVASVAAWQDDNHVRENREKYRRKFETAEEILAGTVDIEIPPAAFYLWLATPIDDETFARELYAQQNVTALPGSYLARETAQGNPGKNRLRISLVAEVDECRDAMQRVREFWCGL